MLWPQGGSGLTRALGVELASGTCPPLQCVGFPQEGCAKGGVGAGVCSAVGHPRTEPRVGPQGLCENSVSMNPGTWLAGAWITVFVAS